MAGPDDFDSGATENETGPAGPAGTLSVDAPLDLLVHHHRRATLRFLSAAPGHTATVDALVVHLRDRGAARPGARAGVDELEAQLHHTHLPKLTAVGVVAYDPRSRELRYWRHERLEALLEELRAYERRSGESK